MHTRPDTDGRTGESHFSKLKGSRSGWGYVPQRENVPSEYMVLYMRLGTVEVTPRSGHRKRIRLLRSSITSHPCISEDLVSDGWKGYRHSTREGSYLSWIRKSGSTRSERRRRGNLDLYLFPLFDWRHNKWWRFGIPGRYIGLRPVYRFSLPSSLYFSINMWVQVVSW